MFSVEAIKELEDIIESDLNTTVEVTQCAHIFSESIDSTIATDPSKDSASMWTVMRHFGYEALADELNGSQIHRLENTMTLMAALRIYFDQMRVWFAATEEENKYKLEARTSFTLRRYPEYVTFTTPDPVNLPVPSPIYLAIHAACAKVAHLSGPSECINKFYRDMEDTKTLDPNGASADMLEHAIFKVQAAGYEIAD